MTIPRRKPRILLLDIETSPIIAAVWTLYEANAIWVVRDTHLNAFSVKWLGEREVTTRILPDYPRYKRNKHDDKPLCRDLWKYLNRADIVIAHNGDSFDIKKVNARFVLHGFGPPDPYKTVDTLKIARRVFKFDSNKLNNICRYAGIGEKLPHTGAKLWEGCDKGDPKAWRTMRRYNARDVSPMLEGAYNLIKGWAPNHPDLRLYTGHDNCPTCESFRIKKRGLHYLKSVIRQRYKCLDCGTAWSGAIVK